MAVTSRKKPNQKQNLKQNQWPKSKAVLFRPDRYEYVKKAGVQKPKKCVFCLSAEDVPSFKSLCLFKNKMPRS